MKTTFKYLAAVLLTAIISAAPAFAQSRLQGRVTDAKGEAVIGAVVLLEGTSVGSVTDDQGRYSLTVPANLAKPVVKVSCMGYKEQSLPLNSALFLNVQLEEDNEQLEEVVVMGYGFVKKSDLTGSVSAVRINENDAARSTSLTNMLQGKASGVQVLNNSAAPDAGVSIRIRGLSSFNGSTEPLYVVDGVMINSSSMSGTLISKGDNNGSDEATNGLMGLNPSDIESIEILKDASATAIYGAMGANGVVLITTKLASREKPVVTFSAGVDRSQVTRRFPVLDFNEFIDFVTYRADYVLKDSYYLRYIYEDVETREKIMAQPADWQQEVLQTAWSQRYYFSISGKPNTLAYNFSLGYSDKEGIVKSTGVKQYTARLNLEKSIGKNFKFGARLNLAYVDSNLTQSTGSGTMTAATSLTRSMLTYHPYRSDTILEDDYNDDDSVDTALKSSPDRWISRMHFASYRKQFRITPNVYAQYQFLPGLTFKSSFGGDYRDEEQQKFKSSFINWSADGSNCAHASYESLYWNWDNTLSFFKRIKKQHSIYGVLGTSTRQTLTTSSSIEGWHINEYKSNVASINAAPDTNSIYSEGLSSTQSFFARAVYSYANRYSLTATYRIDGSSKFQGGNKWASFPSFAVAWNINREKWFKVRPISAAKLRLGWGRVGNQAVSNYQTLSTFSRSTTPTHALGNSAEYVVGMYPSNIANPELKWETNEQVNLGFDLEMFKGRFTLNADAYIKTTYDLLQSKLVPASSGMYSIWVNEGTIQNKGLEFTTSAVPVKFKHFTWELNGNISINRNKIISISDDNDSKEIFMRVPEGSDPAQIDAAREKVDYFFGSQVGGGNYMLYPANIYMEGYPMGLFYGFKTDGVVGVGETGPSLTAEGAPRAEGYRKYVDCNANGYIDDEDRVILGNPNPDFTYGFGTTFTYRHFSITADFIGSFGNDILNVNFAADTQTDQSWRNITREAYNKAWTPENQKTDYPGLGLTESGDYRKVVDLAVCDGSYLRLANLTLGYEFPCKKSKVFRNVTLSATASNLHVWTKYPGWDPDVNSFGTNVKKMGCDLGSYPSCRTFSFDVKFTF